MTYLLPFHLLDEIPRIGLWLKAPRFQIFPEGWGAPYSELEKLYSFKGPRRIPKIQIHWYGKGKVGPPKIRDGTFWVPESEVLPKKIRHAHFREILPPSPGNKICLLLAGWGDHGYSLRMRLAHALNQRGIGTLLLENPFHGRRYLEERTGPPVFNVKEMALLARAAVSEGRALIKEYRKKGFQMGVSGFSMGAGFAGTIASILPFSLPTALLAGAHSPDVPFFKGLLGKGIEWSAFNSVDNPKEKLRSLFQRVSLLNIDPPPPGSRIILFGAKRDRIVLPSSLRKLHRHWPGSKLRWRPGGHISLWLFEVNAMAQAIADSFKPLLKRNERRRNYL